MATHTPVCVHNDLATSEACVSVWPTQNKLASGVDINRRIVVKECLGNGGHDDLFNQIRTNFCLAINTVAMLCRNKHCAQLHWTTVHIFEGDLGLAVGTQVRHLSALSHFSQTLGQTMRKPDGKWHEIWCFVARKSEHHSLVTSTLAVEQVFATHATALFFTHVDTLSNVRALCVERNNNTTGIAVEAECCVVVPNAIDSSASNCRNVNIRIGGDFTRHNTQTSCEERFTRNTTVRIFSQQCIEH